MVSWVIARPPYPTSLQPVGPVGQGDADGQCPPDMTSARSPTPPPSSVPTTGPPLKSCGASPALDLRRRATIIRCDDAEFVTAAPAPISAFRRLASDLDTHAVRLLLERGPLPPKSANARKSSCNREGHPGLILPSECACGHHVLDWGEPFRTTAEPAKAGPTYSAVVAISQCRIRQRSPIGAAARPSKFLSPAAAEDGPVLTLDGWLGRRGVGGWSVGCLIVTSEARSSPLQPSPHTA